MTRPMTPNPTTVIAISVFIESPAVLGSGPRPRRIKSSKRRDLPAAHSLTSTALADLGFLEHLFDDGRCGRGHLPRLARPVPVPRRLRAQRSTLPAADPSRQRTCACLE